MKRLIILLFLSVLVFSCEKDSYLQSETEQFQIKVDTRNVDPALTMINDLITQVTDYVDMGDIPYGPGQSILSKLKSIKKKLEDGKTEVALSKIDALLDHLIELVNDGLLDAEIFNTLMSGINHLSCEVAPYDGDGDGSLCNVDCDDNNDAIYPGAEELCSGGIDEDCDGLIDCEDPDCQSSEDCYFGPTNVCVFWNDIKLAELDGSNLQNINIHTDYVKTEVAFDNANDMIYWCENSYYPSYKVHFYRAKMNGDNIELLLEYNYGAAQGLALDLEEGKLYGSDGTNGNVFRMNLDGTDVELIFNGSSQLGRIVIDYENDKLYWLDRLQSKLYRSNLDGTSMEVVLSSIGHRPNGLQIDFKNDMVYYSDIGATWTINRIKLDGSDHQVIGDGRAFDLAIDLYNQKLYWADPSTQTVKRCDLDGTNLETIVSNIRSYGIALK